jgi:molecular chaperone DnaJ
VRPDPRFVRDGNDIISTVDLTMSEAALGTQTSVPTLDGDVELEFKPGTQPGEIRVPAREGHAGAPGLRRGDHRLLVNVAVPAQPERRAAPAARGVRAGRARANYKAEEGFFEKLRAAFR